MDLTKNHQGIGVKSWCTHSYLIHPSTRQYTAFPARCASVCHGGMPCRGAIVCCLLSCHDTTSLPQGRPLFEARVTWSSQNVVVPENGVIPPPIIAHLNLQTVFKGEIVFTVWVPSRYSFSNDPHHTSEKIPNNSDIPIVEMNLQINLLTPKHWDSRRFLQQGDACTLMVAGCEARHITWKVHTIPRSDILGIP